MKHPALNIGLGGKVSSGNCFYRKLFTCPYDSTTAEKRRLDPLVHYEKKKKKNTTGKRYSIVLFIGLVIQRQTVFQESSQQIEGFSWSK